MEKGSRRINAKSIMGVMMLAAGKGSRVILDTEGELAGEAAEALAKLIAEKFGEDE
jgi:phosphocarrier protein